MRDLFRSWALTAAACGAPAVAVAQSVPAALQACVRITQDSERLACFDREIAALSAPAGSAGTSRSDATASAAVSAASTAAPAASIAAPAATTAAATTSAAAPAVGATAARLTPEEQMGLSAEGLRKLEVEKGIIPADAKPAKELTAHLASVSRNPAGREVFTLDNGQVWRQSETRARFEAHAGDAVKITPGGLGSYWLSTDTHNWTRVERVSAP